MSAFSQLWFGGFAMTLLAFVVFLSIAFSFKLWQDSASEWGLKWILRLVSFFFSLMAFFMLGLEIVLWELIIAPIL
ncbi:hypothetical protein PMW_68 [Pseudomonas phage phiPMW]|uniref:Uncharacterized protein n=1 Tax=Pseudomonas phage phiPMW TaxID=1815582 RepID=A0A1S5R1A3_9CAUD|nr:hypothetical protein FDG97_gp068 [Pseudomonas phage phiPMW]ANA49193.1 hypothetical protein PMW_68 [Pseudomonas phage phiPMW]